MKTFHRFSSNIPTELTNEVVRRRRRSKVLHYTWIHAITTFAAITSSSLVVVVAVAKVPFTRGCFFTTVHHTCRIDTLSSYHSICISSMYYSFAPAKTDAPDLLHYACQCYCCCRVTPCVILLSSSCLLWWMDSFSSFLFSVPCVVPFTTTKIFQLF